MSRTAGLLPDEYLEASVSRVPAEQHESFEQQVQRLYDRMARFAHTPSFVRLDDVRRTASWSG